MRNEEHRLRVARLLRGERNVTDLDRLFSDLRFARPGRPTVTEVGDFAAHREERDKGVAMRRAGDIQTSARIWLRQHFGIIPSIDDARAAGKANLAIATDDQIRCQLGVTRQIARSQFVQGINALERGEQPSRKQRAAVNYLGCSFVWQYALNDVGLSSDFADVLIESGALDADDRSGFLQCADFVALHVMTLMHRARLKLPDGQKAALRARISEQTGTLRIAAEIPLDHLGKPIGCVVPIFETGIVAKDHCAPHLLDGPGLMTSPLEIDREGRLSTIG